MHQRYLEYVQSTGCPWLALTGTPEERARAAIAALADHHSAEFRRAQISRAESALGVVLPSALIAALKAQNGGSIRLSSFRLAPAAAKK